METMRSLFTLFNRTIKATKIKKSRLHFYQPTIDSNHRFKYYIMVFKIGFSILINSAENLDFDIPERLKQYCYISLKISEFLKNNAVI